jgi:hypothetical protein
VEFYVSDRHMQVLILCGTYFAVAGVREIAVRLAAWRAASPGPIMGAPRLTWVLLAVMFLVCLPKTGQRLHANRVGNRVAGLWLAQHLALGDVVDDDHAYSLYYAGLVFEEAKKPILPKGSQPTCYVVLTRSQDADISVERRKKEEEIRARARPVYSWPANRSWDEARVVIYAQPRDFKKQPWTEATH